ncbi:hypothetical protein JTB14_019730 [Gonioctena quinquepunctata]|nr:hypothetical protein JTB14_019730 [Gonioctena quinquepunctata]
MLLPTDEETAMSPKPFLATMTDVMRSGIEVPAARKIAEHICCKAKNGNRSDIFLEKQYVLSSNEFLKAFLMTYALYTIFNLEYPRRIGGTLEHFLREFPCRGCENTLW